MWFGEFNFIEPLDLIRERRFAVRVGIDRIFD